MPRKASAKTPLIILLISFTLFATLSLHLRHHLLYQSTSTSLSPLPLPPPPPPHFLSPPPPPPPLLLSNNFVSSSSSFAIQEVISSSKSTTSSSSSSSSSSSISTASILLPDWEVLVIASPETPASPGDNYTCVFNENSYSPARFASELPFGRGKAFKCVIPINYRRRSPYLQPQLLTTNQIPQSSSSSEERENENENNDDNATIILPRWNSLVYESFTTEHDVVLFVKGVNNRQGINLRPSDLRCVFGDDPISAVRTAVTSSAQEVFRCGRPNVLENSTRKMSVTLEIIKERNVILSSVAQFSPHVLRTIDFTERKTLMCACTMVYNVAKFLREWVMYHARVGVEKFILYDNDSDDDLDLMVDSLNRAGFDVRTVYWPWPKTQEAGFSHCALHAEKLCEWVAFVDVDEFILSPTWLNRREPDPNMLSSSLLPKGTNPARVGQVSVKCVEFGPSNRTVHPVQGVTQGYTCRRKFDRRHKSIVMMEAVHPSLLNVVHHFKLRDGFRSSQLGKHRAIVNHYKYQAWPEFRSKFRRRVSAYVVDWQKSTNLKSNDRAPGLGFQAVEPPGWARRFCEKVDVRLKVLTRKWFRVNSSAMLWQSE